MAQYLPPWHLYCTEHGQQEVTKVGRDEDGERVALLACGHLKEIG